MRVEAAPATGALQLRDQTNADATRGEPPSTAPCNPPVAQRLSVGYAAGVIALLLRWVRRASTLRNRGLAGWMALGAVCGSATFAVWTFGGGPKTRQFTFAITAIIPAQRVDGLRAPWQALKQHRQPAAGRNSATASPSMRYTA